MALRLYKCMNVGNCTNADSGTTFELPELGNSACPECSEGNVIAVRGKSAVPSSVLVLAGVLAVAASGAAGYYFWPQGESDIQGEHRTLAKPDSAAKASTDGRGSDDRERSEIDRAMTFVEKGEYGQAAMILDGVVERQPQNAWAQANLCTAYLRLNRAEEATTACERAVRADEANWLAHYNLATVRLAAGQRAEALSELEAALDLVSKAADPRMTRTELIRQLKSDQSLSALRDDPLFLKFVQLQ